MMQELNLASNVLTIAELYRDIATVIVIDRQDNNAADEITSMGMVVHCTNIIMNNLQDKIDLAQDLKKLSRSL